MADELIDGQWQQSTWNGLPQLTCTHCQWDTLDGLDAAREYRLRCPRCAPPVEPPPPPRLVFVADRWGNPVEQPGAPKIKEINDGQTDIN